MAKITKTDDYGRFELATESQNSNIVWASEGVGGSGKTHFLLTAPEPIGVFLLDPGGLKGLMSNPLFKTKDIRIIDYSKTLNLGKYRDKSDRAKSALEAMQTFEEDWEIAMSGVFRTVGFDKEEQVWEAMRYAYNEDFSAEPKNYYELNMQYRGWFGEAESNGINFGAIRGVKEKWGQTGVSRSTGKPQFGGLGIDTPRGQREVVELVQINLSHKWDDDRKVFVTTILDKCRLGQAKELLGSQHSDLDFDTLHAFLYPEEE